MLQSVSSQNGRERVGSGPAPPHGAVGKMRVLTEILPAFLHRGVWNESRGDIGVIKDL